MKKGIKWLEAHFEETILVLLLIVICTLMIINVVLRYVFHSGIIWGDELCRQCFIATAFFGCAYCIRTNGLMSFETVQKAMPAQVGKIMVLLVDLVMVAAFLYLTVGGWEAVRNALRAGTKSPIMRLPLSVTYTVVFAAYILAAVRAVQKTVCDVHSMLKEKASEGKGVEYK